MRPGLKGESAAGRGSSRDGDQDGGGGSVGSERGRRREKGREAREERGRGKDDFRIPGIGRKARGVRGVRRVGGPPRKLLGVHHIYSFRGREPRNSSKLNNFS